MNIEKQKQKPYVCIKLKKAKLILLLVSILGFNSCFFSDCIYDYKCIVTNKTHNKIKIYYKTSAVHPVINTTIILPKDSSKALIKDEQFDGCSRVLIQVKTDRMLFI
jgi:hypothetical protein